MSRFKVGDRVMASLPVSESWVEYYGALRRQPAKIISVVGRGDYFIELEKPCAKDDGGWFAADKELTPASPFIPDGWTTADEPPKDARNVEVMLRDGKRGYGFWRFIGCKDWRIFDDDANVNRIKTDSQYYPYSNLRTAAPGEVIGWREIQPELLRVGQRVRVKETTSWYKSGDTGTIDSFESGGDLPVYVKFDSGLFYFCAVDNLEPLPDETKPEPEPTGKVDYVVVYDGDEDYGVAHKLDDALDMAKVRAKNDNVTMIVMERTWRKVYEVKPGKPEVIRMEE